VPRTGDWSRQTRLGSQIVDRADLAAVSWAAYVRKAEIRTRVLRVELLVLFDLPYATLSLGRRPHELMIMSRDSSMN
jgi:hypothetical protein